jgi:uncharacterized protein (PEP-CTERM system associated)
MGHGVWGRRDGQRRFGGTVLCGIGLVPLLAGSSLAAESQVTSPITIGSANSDNVVPTQAAPTPPGTTGPAAPGQPQIVAGPAQGAASGRLWSLTTSLGVGETFNDNVNLAPRGQALTDLITTVTPGMNFVVQGARLNLGLNYAPELAYYARGTSPTQLLQNLLGTAKAELYPETLFLNANASVNQQFINSAGAIGNPSLTSSSNSTTVQTYDVSPELRHHFGDYADSDTQYHFGSTTTGSDQVAPSNTNSFLQTVKSGTAFNNLTWTVTGSITRTSVASGGGTTDALAGTSSSDDLGRVDLGYSLNFLNLPSWSVLAGGGYEKLDDATVLQNSAGPIWDLGFKYQPQPYFQVQATYGRRFQQPNYSFNGIYNPGPQTTISVQYSESVETQASLQQTGLENISFNPATGQFQLSPQGQPVPIGNQLLGSSGIFSLSNATFLDKTFNTSIQEVRGRNTYSVTAFDTTETTTIPPTNQREIGGSLSWNRQLWPDLTSTLAASYTNTNFGGGTGRIDSLYTFSAALSYTLSETATATLSLSRFDLESNAAGNGTTNDLVAIQVQKKF